MRRWVEYIGNKLKDTLKKDHLYCVSFYVNRANGGGYSINRIGVLASKDSLPHPPIDCYPVFPNVTEAIIETTPSYEDTVTLVEDTLNWIEIQGMFKAKGGEKFLVLGRFTRWNKCTIHCLLPWNYCSIGTDGSFAGGYAYYYIDDVSLVEVAPAQAAAQPIYTICPGQSILLGTDSTEDAEYNWYPSTFLSCSNCANPIASPTTSITYHLTKKQCKITTTDSVRIIVQQDPSYSPVPKQAEICSSDTFSFPLSLYPNVTFQWFPHSSSYLDSNFTWHASPSSDETYVFEQTWCGRQSRYDTLDIKIADCFDFSIPNVFTPNKDGVNDDWYLQWKNETSVNQFKVEVYNRWGNKVFESNDKYFRWNGQCQAEAEYFHLPSENNQCPTGTYYYVIEYWRNGKKAEHKGYVTLLK
ncbi:MAG: hypothetical protein KatS3mg028_1123 [Bacteroidia bacterium]|nr:MAG: hypothetical protein KatS3mg028_1123 [Bacteroidia bacterium]